MDKSGAWRQIVGRIGPCFQCLWSQEKTQRNKRAKKDWPEV